MGSVIIACLTLLINPDKGPFAIPVNDFGTISQVNRKATTWMAGPSSFFEGWTVGDVKLLEGIGVSQMGGSVAPCTVPETDVPDHFDAREKWPKCFTAPIYSMGNCTASWAIASASAFSNRVCISDPEKHSDLVLSPQQLLSCDSGSRGCNGGDIDASWGYIERAGLVSETCFPYQADSSISCSRRCSEEKPIKASSHCTLPNEEATMREIFLNGPVVVPIFLLDDFLVYRGGIYQELSTAKQLTGADARRNRIVHAVKIVGWGKTQGVKWWLIENSWGEDWGEHGFAKIIRGGDVEKRESIVIESYIVAGTPASPKLEDDDLDDLDDDDDDDDAQAPDIDATASKTEKDDDSKTEKDDDDDDE